MQSPLRLAPHVLFSAAVSLIGIPTGAEAQQPAQPAPAPHTQADWVRKSNENARLMVELMAKLQPETASQLGVDGHDEEITDLSPGIVARQLAAIRPVHAELVRRLSATTDPKVKQDLEILVKAASDMIKEIELSEKLLVPYFSLDMMFFGSFRGLLDDQIAATRRPAALVRLRKYTGLEPGTKPSTELAMAYVRERMNHPGLVAPIRSKIEKDLGQAPFLVEGIGKLFEKFAIKGYEPAYEKLKQQLAAWHEFIKSEVLPRSRDDFRLPPELYSFTLEQFGIDIPPEELAAMAHRAYSDIQGQMQVVAAQVAEEKRLASPDYREVIKVLKKDQLVGNAILSHYQERLKEIEQIIRDKQILTLPARAARIRIATAAESTATPAPNMHPPRLMGNTGEVGEFVLPLNVPDKSGKMQKFDDFNFAAASWTLTAHEARPGHELQFASIIEHGVSDARATFAFNSTNVEGWGLYSEWLIEPFEPADGHLICLQHRLIRAARAFLDIELQTGKITREAGPGDAQERRRSLRRDGQPGSRALYFLGTRPGQLVLLRLHSFTRVAGGDGKSAGTAVQREGLSRLRPGTGAVASALDEESGDGRVRDEAGECIIEVIGRPGDGQKVRGVLARRTWALELIAPQMRVSASADLHGRQPGDDQERKDENGEHKPNRDKIGDVRREHIDPVSRRNLFQAGRLLRSSIHGNERLDE